MREMRVFMVCEGDDKPVRVSGPQQAYEAVREVFTALDREVFYVFPMNARNCITGRHLVSMGSLTGSVVHPREVFKVPVLSTEETSSVSGSHQDNADRDGRQEVYRAAIRANAAALLLAHNHPSGDPTPSQEDIQITKQLVEAGKILGIKVLDHLVLAGDRYISFADESLLDA